MRMPIIAANWKMFKTWNECLEYMKAFQAAVNSKLTDRQAVLIPPAPWLKGIKELITTDGLSIGAQNMYHEDQGAFTGELSSDMILSAGCDYVVIGHSERRTYFNETNKSCNLKIKKALAAGLIPIYCIGETLEQRENDVTLPVVEIQIREGFEGIDASDVSKTVIAYEPVWAIGTGKTATSDQAQEVHKAIRDTLEKVFGKDCAEAVRIQYGGSVKPGNISELMSMPDIDGALVGGAGLDPASFASIVLFK